MNEIELPDIVSVWDVAAKWGRYDPSDPRTLNPQGILFDLGFRNPDTNKRWLPVYRYKGEATDPDTGETVYFCEPLDDAIVDHPQAYSIKYEELYFDIGDVERFAAKFSKNSTLRRYNLMGKSSALLLIEEQNKNQALQAENQALRDVNSKQAARIKALEGAQQRTDQTSEKPKPSAPRPQEQGKKEYLVGKKEITNFFQVKTLETVKNWGREIGIAIERPKTGNRSTRVSYEDAAKIRASRKK